MPFILRLFIICIIGHLVMVQVFNYKTIVAQTEHYATMESLDAEYKAESIRVSEELNDIVRSR